MHSRKADRETFCNKTVASAKHLWMFFQEEVAALSSSVDEAALNAVTTLQGDVAYYQSTVRERLKRLPGQGDAQSKSGPSIVLKEILLLGQWIQSLGLKIV